MDSKSNLKSTFFNGAQDPCCCHCINFLVGVGDHNSLTLFINLI